MALTVDWLRTNAAMAHFFGLGFIQIKLDELTRIHFYHKDIPAFVEDPHDHRYDFISTVLSGCLQNEIWKLVPGDDHEVSYENCRQYGPETPPGFKTGLVKLGSFNTCKGSGYHMNSETLHTVRPLFEHGPVITQVEREIPFKEFARAVKKADAPSTCPFSRPMPDDELWAIVRDCLSVSDLSSSR